MKKLFFLCLCTVYLFGNNFTSIQSFEADFQQVIDDKEKKVVTYYGHLIAQKPQLAKWSYTKPIQKTVYIHDHSVVIIEPELEQAIVRKLQNDFDIFTLLKNAKKIDKNKYQTIYKDTIFTIIFQKNQISKLLYHDNFDNLVTITFSNQKYNKPYPYKTFKAIIPDDYDMIVE